MSSATARVFIVDDHPMLREGLNTMITDHPGMAVCGEASSADEALPLIKTQQPDVAIVDIMLGTGGSGLDLVRDIRRRCPSTKSLVLSAFAEAIYAERALRAGARGYLTKQQAPQEILGAIETVLRGERYYSAQTARRLAESALGGSDESTDPIARLTDRELEVFRRIGQGVPTRNIAKGLHLSIHTIETHREKIKSKLNLGNAAALQREAAQWVLENH